MFSYEWFVDYFVDQMFLSIGCGSIFNHNRGNRSRDVFFAAIVQVILDI